MDGMGITEMQEDRERLLRRALRAEASAKKIQAERDALAAHVERLRGLWVEFNDWDHGDLDGVARRIYEAMDEAPTTSLARLKALWQAEAIEEEVALMRLLSQPTDAGVAAVQHVAAVLCDRAATRRRQAEGDES